jgi:hypothetical protein
MGDTQLGIFWFCIIGFGLYFIWLVKTNTTSNSNSVVVTHPVTQTPPPPPPHPLEHLIQETNNFSYIKFNGALLCHYVTNTTEVPLALKELKFFKKVLNADKKSISDQLRTIRANVSGVKGVTSIPSRSKLMKGVRYGIRAATSFATVPLENQKSLYNSLLLQCDRVQIEIERI